MGVLSLSARAGRGAAVVAAFFFCLSGCQVSPTMSRQMMARHQAVLDTTGLGEAELVEPVKARCAPPQRWEPLKLLTTRLYTDMQWRSPSRLTGVGVAYIRMPLPLPAGMLVWFAKQEYCKRSDDGKLIREWTDELGRPWFEAENRKYHVRGCVFTKGFEAWIVYSGYKTSAPPKADEIATAQRAAQTILPAPLAPTSQTPTASAE